MSTNKTCWEFWTFWLVIFKSFLTQTSTVIFFLFIDLWCGSGTFFVSFKLSSCSTWKRRQCWKWWRSSYGISLSLGNFSWSGKSYVWQHLVLFTIDIRFDGEKGIVSDDWTKKSCWTESFTQLPVRMELFWGTIVIWLIGIDYSCLENYFKNVNISK